MPRNWTRKTSKASWTAGNLQAAAVRIRQGVSIRKVAKETGIPFSTLQRRIKEDKFIPPKLGRHAVFNEEQENVLTERILKLSNMFHGLTTNQLRKITFECAENLKLSHNFNRDTKMAGRDWIQGFLKRKKKIKEVKKNLFKSSSSEESTDEQVPYDESGDSDIENIEIPLNIQQNSQKESDQSVCAICFEEGKPREIWYRCRLCAGWAHEACTGCDDPSRYRCDFCN